MSMSFRAVALVVAALPSLALADADPAFTKLRDKAEAIGGLGAFLDKYVGDCGSVLEGGGDCEKNANQFRNSANGKKYYMIVTEDSSPVLQTGGFNPRGAEVVLNLTPFFPASNSAVTHGAPTKTDANGNPVLPFIQIKGVLPEGWNIQMFERQVQARALRIQVVFTPQGKWQLPKKGGGTIKGVKAKLEAVLITVGRTGEQVALWVNK